MADSKFIAEVDRAVDLLDRVGRADLLLSSTMPVGQTEIHSQLSRFSNRDWQTALAVQKYSNEEGAQLGKVSIFDKGDSYQLGNTKTVDEAQDLLQDYSLKMGVLAGTGSLTMGKWLGRNPKFMAASFLVGIVMDAGQYVYRCNKLEEYRNLVIPKTLLLENEPSTD